MASVLFASDQRLSLVLFILSLATFLLMLFKTRRSSKELESYEYEPLHQVLTTFSNAQYDNKEETLNPTCSKTTNECSLEGLDLRHYKLTPMQRRLMELMLRAQDYRVGKYDLCEALWDGKSNAEESLYTLIRRTKQALKGSGIEIICNRGESYELLIKH